MPINLNNDQASRLLTIDNIGLVPGDLFTTDAKAIVIPKSTTGTVSEAFLSGLKRKYEFVMSKALAYQPLGELHPVSHGYPGTRNDYQGVDIIFATSVDNNTSDLKYIERLLENIVAFANQNPHISRIAMPLLGTGAGGLSPRDVFKIIQKRILKNNKNNVTLLIYVSESVYEELREEMEREVSDSGQAQGTAEILNQSEADLEFFLKGRSIALFDINSDINSSKLVFKSAELSAFGIPKKQLEILNPGDIIIGGSNWNHEQNPHSFIRGIGVVVTPRGKSKGIQVSWVFSDETISVQKRVEIPPNSLFILAEGDAIGFFLGIQQWPKIMSRLAQVPSSNTNYLINAVDKIATLHNDTLGGDDQLDISQDYQAFARIIASNSFTPPLSIALFGKWGSGKSFFMQKLDGEISRLSKEGDAAIYRRGIVQIHFNAWSYMDANLWASIVSRIFEGLNHYINEDSASDKEKELIKAKLNKQLVITSEKLEQIETQKAKAEEDLQTLQQQKEDVQKELTEKIAEIQSGTFTAALKAVDEQFNVQDQLNAIFKNDASVQKSVKEISELIPKKYQDNPVALYNEAKSGYTFLRYFFQKDRVWWNLAFVGIILLGIWVMPYLIDWLKLRLRDYVLPYVQFLLYSLTLLVPVWIRVKKVLDRLRPAVSAFWNVRENYRKQIEHAKLKGAQLEKSLELEIAARQQQISAVDKQILATKEEIAVLTVKNDHAIATEALYSFIEKRCNSEEYQKHLGIVSIIRRDFEVLSGLFIDHQDEVKVSAEVEEFRKLFKNPLERIVLYIDDLDRCPEERVIEVLEAVNLLMAFPLFVVIVGVDPRWVKRALTEKRGLRDEDISVADYLEKIFQVPFHLKKADDENVKAMLRSLITSKAKKTEGLRGELPKATGESIFASESLAKHIEQEIRRNPPLGQVLQQSEEPEEEEVVDEHLEISEKERELILEMSAVIGNNPRAIKRFINIYYIVRAHRGLVYMSDRENHEFQVVMFLLAIYTGKYKRLATSMMRYFTDARRELKTLENFLEEGQVVDSLGRLRQELSFALSERVMFGNLLGENAAVFKHHDEFISRFTFEND